MRNASGSWWLSGAALVVMLFVAGCAGRSSSASRQFDPAMRAAAMITGLERTDQPVTKAQAGKLLPLFRALRGTAADDRPAVDALVRQIDVTLTDGQREALRRLREQRRLGPPGAPRSGPGGDPGSRSGPDGPGGPPRGFGPAGPGVAAGGQPSAQRLAAFRGQMLDRAIALLETRVQ